MTRPTYLGFPDATGSMSANEDAFHFDGLGQGPSIGPDTVTRTLTPEMEGRLHEILVQVLGYVPDGWPRAGDVIPRAPRRPRRIADALDEAFLRTEAATEAKRLAWQRFHLVVFTDGEPDPVATDRINSARK